MGFIVLEIYLVPRSFLVELQLVKKLTKRVYNKSTKHEQTQIYRFCLLRGSADSLYLLIFQLNIHYLQYIASLHREPEKYLQRTFFLSIWLPETPESN